ncbi:FeoA family protein [uncultured Victivallis sp.]|uniref:FeoA family protein n=1 Tax=uncultured Victivallis sp. TaxID=354118 RepID=UPI0025D0089C|nr:FeoA family protein [uncultured Victivallis sp.]
MSKKRLPCSRECGVVPVSHRPSGVGEKLTLAELPVGAAATIIKVVPNSRGGRKFADVGLVAGTELLMEAHAPFGGLLRVKLLGTSMALHRNDAVNIILENK